MSIILEKVVIDLEALVALEQMLSQDLKMLLAELRRLELKSLKGEGVKAEEKYILALFQERGYVANYGFGYRAYAQDRCFLCRDDAYVGLPFVGKKVICKLCAHFFCAVTRFQNKT